MHCLVSKKMSWCVYCFSYFVKSLCNLHGQMGWQDRFEVRIRGKRSFVAQVLIPTVRWGTNRQPVEFRNERLTYSHSWTRPPLTYEYSLTHLLTSAHLRHLVIKRPAAHRGNLVRWAVISRFCQLKFRTSQLWCPINKCLAYSKMQVVWLYSSVSHFYTPLNNGYLTTSHNRLRDAGRMVRVSGWFSQLNLFQNHKKIISFESPNNYLSIVSVLIFPKKYSTTCTISSLQCFIRWNW